MVDWTKIRGRLGWPLRWIRSQDWRRHGKTLSMWPVHWARRASRQQRFAVMLVAAYLTLLVWAIVKDHIWTVMLCTLLTAVAFGLVRRMVRVGGVRRNRIQDARGHTRWPRLLGGELRIKQGERVRHEERMHPIFIVHSRKVGGFAVGLALTLIASLWTSWFLIGSLVTLIGMLVFMTPRFITWWFTRRCYTNIRVIVVTGVFFKNRDSAVLKEIKSVGNGEPFISPLLRYLGIDGVRHWHFDTLVQRDPFNDLLWTRYASATEYLIEEPGLQWWSAFGFNGAKIIDMEPREDVVKEILEEPVLALQELQRKQETTVEPY